MPASYGAQRGLLNIPNSAQITRTFGSSNYFLGPARRVGSSFLELVFIYGILSKNLRYYGIPYPAGEGKLPNN